MGIDEHFALVQSLIFDGLRSLVQKHAWLLLASQICSGMDRHMPVLATSESGCESFLTL